MHVYTSESHSLSHTLSLTHSLSLTLSLSHTLHVGESVREGVALHLRETPSLARARLHVKEGKLERVSEREWLYTSEKVSGRE